MDLATKRWTGEWHHSKPAAPPVVSHTRLQALRSGGFCCSAVHHYYDLLRLPLGAPPLHRPAAYRPRLYRQSRCGPTQPPQRGYSGAKTDLSCSAMHCATIPPSIPGGYIGAAHSKLFTPSMAFAAVKKARLPHCGRNEAARFLIVRTGCLLAAQSGFVMALRRSGLPFRRPPATGLLGHYPDRTFTGKPIAAWQDTLHHRLKGWRVRPRWQ
jgi:hypothetical protein